MPKMKTSKTAAKRFKTTGTGRLDGEVDVHPGDAKKIKRLLAKR